MFVSPPGSLLRRSSFDTSPGLVLIQVVASRRGGGIVRRRRRVGSGGRLLTREMGIESQNRSFLRFLVSDAKPPVITYMGALVTRARP